MNPIITSKDIQKNLQDYIRRALPVERALPEFTNPLDDLFRNYPLAQAPYLEIMPGYESGETLQSLVDAGVIYQETADIFAKYFLKKNDLAPNDTRDVRLYSHQSAAIRDVCQGQKNLVVCSGTGSGKTECFLIPLVNHIVEEYIKAGSPSQWDASGVRAMILYPMNALVNDQIRRLRQILKHAPYIKFGKYTGELDAVRDEETLRPQLEAGISRHRDDLANASNGVDWSGAGFDDEAPLRNEVTLRSVWHSTPAHILVTNYSMLERLLLQPETSGLFNSHWKFIILDEAHCYDGALGTEIAWLVRRVKRRIGNPCGLRFMATSATLIDDPDLNVQEKADRVRREFASRLFPAGAETFSVQFGSPLPFTRVEPAYEAQNGLNGGAYRALVDKDLTTNELAQFQAAFQQFPGAMNALQGTCLFSLTQGIIGLEAWNSRLVTAVNLAEKVAQPMAAGDALYLVRVIRDTVKANQLSVVDIDAIGMGMFEDQDSLDGLQALVRFVNDGVGNLDDWDQWRNCLHDYGDPKSSTVTGDTYEVRRGIRHQNRYGNRLQILAQWKEIRNNNLSQLTIEGLEYLLKAANDVRLAVEETFPSMPEPMSIKLRLTPVARNAVQSFVTSRAAMETAIQQAREILTVAWRQSLQAQIRQQPVGNRIEDMLAWLLGGDRNLMGDDTGLAQRLRDAMANEGQADQAKFDSVSSVIFPDDPEAGEHLDALVSLAALAIHPTTRRPLLDIRYHQLLRGLRQVGISFADEQTFALHVSDAMTVGEGEAERAMFTLGVCRTCGQPFVLGYTGQPQLNTGAGIQFLGRMKTDNLKYLHAIAWKQGEIYPDAEDGFPRNQNRNIWLNVRTGQTLVGALPPAGEGGWLQGAWYVAPDSDNSEFLAQCPCCGDKHDRARDNRYGVITPYEAHGEQLKLALLDELVRRTDTSSDPSARCHPGDGRKVLAFSDSRKGAAGLAFRYQELFNNVTVGLLAPKAIRGLINIQRQVESDLDQRNQDNNQIDPVQNPRLNQQQVANQAAAIIASSSLFVCAYAFRSELESNNCSRLLEISDDSGADMEEGSAAKLRLLQALRKKGRSSLLRRQVIRLESKAINAARALNGTWNGFVQGVGGNISAANLFLVCNEILIYLFERATLTVDSGWPHGEINSWSKLICRDHAVGYLWFVRNNNQPGQSIRHGLNRIVRETLQLTNDNNGRTQAHNVLEVLWPLFMGQYGGSCVLQAQPEGKYRFNHMDLVIRVGNAQNNPNIAPNERYDAYLASRPIVPVRIEEHTAQLANERAAAYQKAFSCGKVNILSCSTTFEMGVDLGDLTCVFLSNLPPGVANYRQRAGRAGRRPGTVAYVLSFVGETPHEQYYFDKPEELLFGRVQTPKIYLENSVFRARHLRAEAFHDFLMWMDGAQPQYWETVGSRWGNNASNGTIPVRRNWHLMSHFFAGRRAALVKINGQRLIRITATFNPIVDEMSTWVNNRDTAVKAYIDGIDGVLAPLGYSVAADLVWQLQSQQQPPACLPYPLAVENILRYKDLAGPNQPESEVNGAALVLSNQPARREVRERLRALYDRIGASDVPDVIGGQPPRNPTLQQVRLLNEQTITWLTRNRVLPKYGFPVDVIRLLPAQVDVHARNVELERDMKIGLYEYAPGQVVLADKRVYEVGKVEVFLPSVGNNPAAAVREFYLCSACHQPHDAGGGACDSCGGQVDNQSRQAIQPDAFRATGSSKAGNAGIPLERGTPLQKFTGEFRNLGAVDDMSLITADSETGELLYLNFGPNYQGFSSVAVGAEGRSLFHRVKTDIVAWLPKADLFVAGGALFALGLNTPRLKGAMQSALSAILRAASLELEVADRDIGGITYPYAQGSVGFVLFDESDGGGGAVLPLALTGIRQQDEGRHTLIRRIVSRAKELCQNCYECNAAFGALAPAVLALTPVSRGEMIGPNPPVNSRARQSCYKCLRSYRNQRVHYILDRGDAVNVLEALLL